MDILLTLLIAGCVFGICFLVDKAFTRVFRSKKQHKSGMSVRLSRRVAIFGLLTAVIGIAGIISGIPQNLPLIIGGGVLVLLGSGMVIYYLSFGIFYDADGFVLAAFGKKEITYAYKDICSQQLFNSAGNIIIELHFADGRAVQLQSAMEGVYPFLDKAFESWLRQTGRKREDCDFYDPSQSCWFPPVEV